jgi:inorganic phosphate transporter, PiT family
MPISTTHSDVGALIGAGLAGVSSSALNWTKVTSVAASWVVSPLVSGILAAFIFVVICYLTLDSNFSGNSRLVNVTLLSGFSLASSSYMVIGLLSKKVKFSQVYLIVISTGILGFLASRIILLR